MNNLLQMSKSAISGLFPSGHFAAIKGRVLREDLLKPRMPVQR